LKMQGVTAEQLEELNKRRLIQRRKRAFVQSLLSPEAYEKLANIRAANPELYDKLTDLVLALAQRGAIKGGMTVNDFQALVARVNPRKETKITFKR